MKVGILNTDALKPEFVAEFGEYPDMFAELFLAVNPSVTLQTYSVMDSHYPEHFDEVDGYVITGSKASVYDDVPWIHELIDFVQVLHAEKKKLVGICFGHQLVAHALGGKTLPATVGWNVGVQRNELTAAASSYQITEDVFHIPLNHQDQVAEVAPGASILASTASCPIAATGLGEHILTFQGHPEFQKGYARALLDMRREILGEPTYQAAIESLNAETDNLRVARWILDFIAA